MYILSSSLRGDNTVFMGGREGVIGLFVQKVQKERGKADKHDDIPFNKSGRWFLFWQEYAILSPSGEEQTSSHKENST